MGMKVMTNTDDTSQVILAKSRDHTGKVTGWAIGLPPRTSKCCRTYLTYPSKCRHSSIRHPKPAKVRCGHCDRQPTCDVRIDRTGRGSVRPPLGPDRAAQLSAHRGIPRAWGSGG